MTRTRSKTTITVIAVSLVVAVIIAVTTGTTGAGSTPSPLHMPSILVERVPFEIRVEDPRLENVPFAVIIVDNGDEAVFSFNGVIPAVVRNVRVPESGSYQIILTTAGDSWESQARSINGLLALLPPLIAILVALVFRQVHVALFAGVWLGAMVVTDFNPLAGFFYVVDHYVVDTLAGSNGWDHVSIVIFTLMLGGLVGIVSRSGGARGVVTSLARYATTPRRGQFATWLMGIVIFFDDYTNTLIVGNTMRPVTDRLKVSREKLSYLVDSTAAPVACVAVITSWIGFEISLIKDAFDSIGMIDRNPFTTFVSAIPYSYYPLFTLFFGLLVALMWRDYGPMLGAERRAWQTGDVLRAGAVPLSNIDTDITPAPGVRDRWFNAAVPIAVVVFGTVIGLVVTGRAESGPAGSSPGVLDAIRSGNSFVALLWSSFAGCVAAVLMVTGQRILTLSQTMNAWAGGVKSMTPAIIILVLAWSIGSVCADLHTADYLVVRISDVLVPHFLPALIFLVAAAVSFSTGTSWGTMTILTPLCIPLVVQVSDLNEIGSAAEQTILLSSIAAILSGAVFGDHCSPISDTTIMSSMASTSDHIDHVRTQLPYAVTVALISVVVGYLPAAFSVPDPLVLLLGAAAVYAVIRWVGKPVATSADQQ